MFDSIRKISLVILTLSVVFLTFLAILGVWEVVSGDVLEKSLATMGLLIFSSLLVFFVSLERDKMWIFNPERNSHNSTGMNFLKTFILFILFIWLGGIILGMVL